MRAFQGSSPCRLASAALGAVGAIAGLSAAGYAFVIYMVEGTNGVANPYAPRVGFGIAAFALALVAGVGAALVYRRPQLGSLLMIGASVLGSAAIALFNINTWYLLSVPLCSFGAVLAARCAPRSPASLAIGFLPKVLLLAAAVSGYFVAGIAVAAMGAVLLVIALWMTLTRSARA